MGNMINLQQPTGVFFEVNKIDLLRKIEEVVKEETGIEINVNFYYEDLPEVLLELMDNDDDDLEKLEELGYPVYSTGDITPILISKAIGISGFHYSLDDFNLTIMIRQEDYQKLLEEQGK